MTKEVSIDCFTKGDDLTTVNLVLCPPAYPSLDVSDFVKEEGYCGYTKLNRKPYLILS
jgi:hypothetical protein